MDDANPLQPRDNWPTEFDEILPQFFGPADSIDEFVTADELDEIAFQMFRTFKKRRHYRGGTFKFEDFDTYPMWKILYPKLKELWPWLREDDILTGNGYITGTNYALHMDSCNPNTYHKWNQMAIKSFLLPIFTCQPDGYERDSSFVVFKNRLLGWECNFSNGSSNDVKLVYQQNVTSYDDLPWVDEHGQPMKLDTSKCHHSVAEIYDDHLIHLPYKTYHGMVLDKIVPYKERGIITFDPYAPHVTGNKDWSKTRLKGGIRFLIQRKLENF